MKTPDGIEPIIAWRAWRVGTPTYLASTNNNTRWVLGDMTAECIKSVRMYIGFHDGPAPSSECPDPGCGIYAVRQLEDLIDQPGVPRVRELVNRQNYVVGQVALWGKIIEHERGYRAQYARPVSIGIFDGSPTYTQSVLATYYGLKYVGAQSLADLAKHRQAQYGQGHHYTHIHIHAAANDAIDFLISNTGNPSYHAGGIVP